MPVVVAYLANVKMSGKREQQGHFLSKPLWSTRRLQAAVSSTIKSGTLNLEMTLGNTTAWTCYPLRRPSVVFSQSRYSFNCTIWARYMPFLPCIPLTCWVQRKSVSNQLVDACGRILRWPERLPNPGIPAPFLKYSVRHWSMFLSEGILKMGLGNQ